MYAILTRATHKRYKTYGILKRLNAFADSSNPVVSRPRQRPKDSASSCPSWRGSYIRPDKASFYSAQSCRGNVGCALSPSPPSQAANHEPGNTTSRGDCVVVLPLRRLWLAG